MPMTKTQLEAAFAPPATAEPRRRPTSLTTDQIRTVYRVAHTVCCSPVLAAPSSSDLTDWIVEICANAVGNPHGPLYEEVDGFLRPQLEEAARRVADQQTRSTHGTVTQTPVVRVSAPTG